MSKKNLLLMLQTALLFVTSILVFTSCGSDELGIPEDQMEEDAWVKITPRSLNFPAEGGNATITVESGWNQHHNVWAFDEDMVLTDYATLDNNCKEWYVICAPNYKNEPRETWLFAESASDGDWYDYLAYLCYDSILVKQEAGGLPAKLADLKIAPGAIEFEIRSDDSNWQYDDEPTMAPQPYLDKVRGFLRYSSEKSKTNITTKVVNNKYLVDIDIESPLWGYDPDENIPRIGANYLNKVKLSLVIGLHSDKYGDDFIVEKGTLYFNEEGEGLYTNPVNGVNGAAEYATHIELDLKNIRGDWGPAGLLGVSQKDLDRGVRRSLAFYYPGYAEDDDSQDGQLAKRKYTATDPSITGTGYKKFFAMPNGTEVKPATAKSGDNKQWVLKLVLWYAN